TQTSTVTAGTYSVEVEDANGCLGTSVSVVVVENPLPIVFLGNDTIICDDATLDIDAGSFASYTWNTGSDEATITVDEAGTYIVEVTDENGCTATDDIVVDLTVCIGIDEIGETYRIEVYPNPANDLLNVNYNIKANISELAVVDMFGRVLIQSTIDSNSQQFDVSSLNTGVYFVKIQWSGKTEIIKFIKQ
ncbi:MAG: T9SS type A sorting domain-containing protein, partial [Bacteroidales bacterium]|nr:T9SS type A sorting domain-containing protein [Bacteroidales bacterium]